jgi:L-fuconolactonase
MSTKPVNIIDPHLHFFDLTNGEYAWLKSQNPPHWADKQTINRNYSEQDLYLPPEITLAGFVHIEAGFDNQQPWREIDWLESTCSLPFKTIACADLTSTSFAYSLSKLTQRPSVVGVRHILDDGALSILTHQRTLQHFTLLNDQELIFEAQLLLSNDSAIDQLIQLAIINQRVSIIINHGGWPPAKNTKEFQHWNLNLSRLSGCPNVAIKLSGWEMTERRWTMSDMQYTVSQILDYFETNRIMLASNFPLCTLSCSYSELWQRYLLGLPLSETEFNQLTFSNAQKWYKFT